MQYKKTAFKKALQGFIRRIFHTRNVIIVSAHKVDHIPLSASMQVLAIVAILTMFSGISYLTGSYVAARSSIQEKEQKIATTSLEKHNISEEMTMLKQDLVKLSQNGKELDAYGSFLAKSYDNEADQAAHFSSQDDMFSADNAFSSRADKLAGRVNYLESRMNELREENEHLVTAIRERTDKKIDYFEDIIAMTGLNADTMEHLALEQDGAKHKAGGVSSADPYNDTTSDNAAPVAPVTHMAHANNQGGPFIAYNSTLLSDSDNDLLNKIDRLVLLHDVVEHLPLRMPIKDAQLMSPFGKRVDPINGRWSIHPGLDMASSSGARITSANAGVVISAGRRIAYGNMVDIDHGFGIVTRYAHLSKIVVHEGQKVAKGQLIGIQGSTGRATGPHLHFEVRINDRPVNPANFLRAGEYVLEN